MNVTAAANAVETVIAKLYAWILPIDFGRLDSTFYVNVWRNRIPPTITGIINQWYSYNIEGTLVSVSEKQMFENDGWVRWLRNE